MESGLDVGFVEGAVVAVLWEIGVVLGEDGAGLGGIAGETGMGSVARRRNRRELRVLTLSRFEHLFRKVSYPWETGKILELPPHIISG